MDEAVRAALEKIEASGGFAASDRLRRFLRFAVQAKLDGQERQIKESIIGREVYDRGEGYDPRTDPIVRVEARRLRAKLKAYYEGEGRDDLVRIEFPTGTYVPAIHFLRPTARVQEVLPAQFQLWPVASVALLVASVSLLMLTAGAADHFWQTPSETIAVVPVRWAAQEVGDTDHVDEKLAAAVASELSKRRTARVIAWPSALPNRGERKEVGQVAKELGAAKVLMVGVQAEQGETRVTIYLVDAASNEKMWGTDFSRSDMNTSEAQRDLARSVADEFEAKKCKTPPYWSYRISMA